VKKNPTAHSQNIVHVDVCITLKERNEKRFVQNWHSPSHLRQNGHDSGLLTDIYNTSLARNTSFILFF
jgi:hypothetical protein